MHRQSRFSPIHPVVIGLSLLLASASMAHATVRNVPAAYPGLQAAINAAANGDTVLVAPGVYSAASIDTLGKAITIKSSGGASTCILDGGNNHYVFNIHSGELATTVINGFTLQRGYGDYGGAMHMESSSPTIINCVLQNSTANYGGGALYTYYASPKISGCTFQNNKIASSGFYGGAVFVSAGKPSLTNCLFLNNSAPDAGGGICVGGAGMSSVTGCTFENNSSSNGDGGGIYVDANCNAKISKCTFTNNTAYSGGGLFLYANASQVTTCTIDSNTASGGGGGATCLEGKQIFSGCWLNDNTAYYGGGLLIDSANAKLTNCSIVGNQATTQDAGYGGGGLWIAIDYASSSPVVTGCLFDSNSALNGGGVWNNGGNATISGCTFTHDMANSFGGGLYSDAGKSILVNCVFDHCGTTSYNSINGSGAAMCFAGSATSAYVTNCSESRCLAWGYGDGIYASTGAVVGVANTIIWDNDYGYELNTDNTATVTVTYSDVCGGWSGTGNLDADPLYADPDNGDLYLQAGSPCILAGSGSVPYFPKTDIEGVLRSTTKPSIGAYEVP